jgi:protein SCO1/2
MSEASLLRPVHRKYSKRRAKQIWIGFLFLKLAGFASFSLAGTTNYDVRGLLKEVKPHEHQLVIAHDEIPNFMNAMTMPFKVKDSSLLKQVLPGERIRFKLHVAENESWIDHIESLGGTLPAIKKDSLVEIEPTATAIKNNAENSLRIYKFTNELGQQVSLEDFRGQAIALTFFFTRCPIPEFCPRLSRNFQEVQHRLKAMENAPTNWHLLSVTFDPMHDTPEVLKTYATSYGYDPIHWSFLTGPADKIAELAQQCDVQFNPENGLINHNFRTLVIDAANRLQMIFPTSGDISQSIAQELIKAAAATSGVAKTH